jgi:hypothetical protein
LANSLRGCGFDKEEVLARLRETGIDGSRRGETLFMEEFAALSRAYGPINVDSGEEDGKDEK